MRDADEVWSAMCRFVCDSCLGCKPLALDGAVDGGAADAEQLRDLEGAVLAAVHQRYQVRLLLPGQLGLLALQPALAFATFIPSTVCSRIRSDSNSATKPSRDSA
jgi:hypothetical protein